MSRRSILFLSAAVLLLAHPAAAQDECSMEAFVRTQPVQQIPTDAPIFAPLRWGMTRDQIRRALTADGWRRDASQTEQDAEWFVGELFGHRTSVAATRTASGLALVSVFVSDDTDYIWNRSLWNEVIEILTDGYGPPISTQGADQPYGGSTYCSSLNVLTGTQSIKATWETMTVGVVGGCQISIHYSGPGLPGLDHANALTAARAADRQCRADVAREQRDRNRLAPGASDRASRRLAAPAPPLPPPDDLSETAPVLIGGIERLQQGIVYPSMEQRARIEGRVMVRFTVGVDGVPINIEVVRSVSPGLDRVSVEAVQRARFEPGRVDGHAVEVSQTLPIQFRIAGDPPPSPPSAPYSPR